MSSVGRPTDYTPALCQQVIDLGKQGKSHAQIAATLGVSRQSLYNWQQSHPEFMDAVNMARDLAQAWFEDKAQAGMADKTFNGVLWEKQVKARFRSEYGEHVTLAGDKDAPLSGMTPAQLDEKIAKLLQLNAPEDGNG